MGLFGKEKKGTSHLIGRKHRTAIKRALNGFTVPERCVYRTERERAEADAMGPLLLRQAAAEAGEGSLTGAVGPPVGKGVFGGMAAHIHDQSTARLAQEWNNALADLEDAGEVELKQPLPPLQRHLSQGSGPGRAGVVDNNGGMQATGAKLSDPGLDNRGITEIDLGDFHARALTPELFGKALEVG